MGRALKAFLYLIYFALVIVLAGFITHSFTSNTSTSPNPPAVHHTTVATPKPALQTPAPTPSPALTNTGPGNVVVVFIGASIIGSIAYRQLLVTRLKNRA
jgi:hypothetical protein